VRDIGDPHPEQFVAGISDDLAVAVVGPDDSAGEVGLADTGGGLAVDRPILDRLRSVMSRKLITTPVTAPRSSSIAAEQSSIGSDVPPLVTRSHVSIWLSIRPGTDRATGISAVSRVSRSTARKTSLRGRPAAWPDAQPVSPSATGFSERL
jgi:hypothetical protein